MLIGIGGYLGSGKSRLADHLSSRHGFSITSPIDCVKELAHRLGFSDESLYGSSESRGLPHPTLCKPDGSPLITREWLDRVSAAVRADCPDILLVASMRGPREPVGLVNESIRKRAEFDAIRAAGGKMIKRKGGTRRGDEFDEVGDMPDHMFDAVIGRMDTLEQLYGVIDTLVDGWRAEEGR